MRNLTAALAVVLAMVVPASAHAISGFDQDILPFRWVDSVVVKAIHPLAVPVPEAQESAPGMDLGLDGVRLPINIQDHVPTNIAPEWNPIFDERSPTGRRRVGETTTFSFRDCRENIGRVNWFIRHQLTGRDPIMLAQDGRCSMTVRWQDPGNHILNLNYSYKYYDNDNNLRTVTSIESDPMVVEVEDRPWLKRNWKMLAGIAGAAVVGTAYRSGWLD